MSFATLHRGDFSGLLQNTTRVIHFHTGDLSLTGFTPKAKPIHEYTGLVVGEGKLIGSHNKASHEIHASHTLLNHLWPNT